MWEEDPRTTRLRCPPADARAKGGGDAFPALPQGDAGDVARRAALIDEARLLQRLGISKPLIQTMADRALRHHTTIEQELLASGVICEDAYYGSIARMFGFPYLKDVPAALVTDVMGIDSQLKTPRLIRLHGPGQPPLVVVVPEIRGAEALARRLRRKLGGQETIAIATPSTVRSTVWTAGQARRSQEVIGRLFEKSRDYSARLVMTGEQGFSGGVLLSFLIFLAVLAPVLALSVLHVFLSLFHLAALSLRACLLNGEKRRRKAPLPVPDALPGRIAEPLPVYTVLVAIYREAGVVPQLLAALSALDWPRSLLDIKLVCEADDEETLSAIEREQPGPQFEIVRVPPCHPRTKPKALSYALCGARGEFLTIYDAEDRPDPGQLREAYHAFRTGPADLACLQAPLIIANTKDSWISAIFGLEYAALFRRLLPALARQRLPLPLGGTSNHFKTAILRACNGWDPFNVTEDADLGMRLYRLGYRSATLTCPTFEDAPTTFKVWLGQRTRWYKGWLQTWLVHMRNPRRAARDMGLMPFIVFQLLVGGMLVAALSHPALILFLGTTIAALLSEPAQEPSLFTSIMFSIDLANIGGAYLIFFAVGSTAMSKREVRSVGLRWLLLPVYWLGVSLAAWKAVFELRFRPFYWNKTPHAPSSG